MNNREILIGQCWMQVDSYGVLRRYTVESFGAPGYGASTFGAVAMHEVCQHMVVVLKEENSVFRTVRSAEQVIADYLPGN